MLQQGLNHVLVCLIFFVENNIFPKKRERARNHRNYLTKGNP